MQVGRYHVSGRARPFLSSVSGRLFDWRVLLHEFVPHEVRDAVHLALSSGTDEHFCSALLPIESFLSSEPDFLDGFDPDASLNLDLANKPLPPPVRPKTFICVGLNYIDHAQESKMEIPKQPLLFSKSSNALNGHNCEVIRPAISEQLDYEAELAIVIGRTCHGVDVQHAREYIAGYTCANDISARDFQFSDGQWYRGKSCDTFGPLGPWIVTPGDIPDDRSLRVQCRLNGKSMQDGTTRDMIFGVPELVAYVSTFITLQPGDVIATGTPPGVGFARKPPVYLQPGDCVEVEIENVGVLRNFVATAAERKP